MICVVKKRGLTSRLDLDLMDMGAIQSLLGIQGPLVEGFMVGRLRQPLGRSWQQLQRLGHCTVYSFDKALAAALRAHRAGSGPAGRSKPFGR